MEGKKLFNCFSEVDCCGFQGSKSFFLKSKDAFLQVKTKHVLNGWLVLKTGNRRTTVFKEQCLVLL